MGQGLSSLQRQILCLAWQEKFITCEEILTELWGLQSQKGRSKTSAYASAHASLSRTLTRLFFRGLITYWQDKLIHSRTGITLTDRGKVMAQAISEGEAEDADNG
jgi:hypothetical protein